MKYRNALISALLLIFLLVLTPTVKAQLSVETSGIVSSSGTTPFWFQSDRSGIYSNEGSQFLTRLQYHSSYEELSKIKFFYGASLIARPGKRSTLSLNQGYLRIKGYGFELAAGRFIENWPLYNHSLGMGVLGTSINATPVPKIKFGLTDWTGIPFTNDFIQIQGYIAHGWLGSKRYTDDVLLHEKALYLKAGGDWPVNLYAGLVHYVLWGGNNHPREGDIPNRWKDFVDVFLARSGDSSTPGIDQPYVIGDQLGTWTFGSQIQINDSNISVYLQSPIETKYDLKLSNISDILTGISINFDKDLNIPFDHFVYEYLYTKDQSGPRRLDPDGDPEIDRFRGNQNYYNHQTYRTGWAYQLRTIGNPLFKVSDENLGILNNRIVAHHIGFDTKIDQVQVIGKATFSRNYGKRCDNRIPDIGEQELFGIRCENDVNTIPGHSLEQWSFLLGTEFPIPIIPEQNIMLRIEAAIDNGRLFGDQFGLLTSIRWMP